MAKLVRSTALSLLGALMLMAPGVASAADRLEVAVPEPTGSNQIGTRSFELLDRARPAGFGESGRRRLMVQLTYPLAGRRPDCRESRYLSPSTEKKLIEAIAVGRPVSVRTGSCAGGPVKRRELPLLVFSHAFTASRGVYASLINDLASRGFLVASVDHTYDAFNVGFPGGDSVDGLFGAPLAARQVTIEELEALIRMRTADLRFVTTRLLAENRKRHGWLSGRIDPGRIGALGHSLGGASATRLATLDRRVRSSADLDGSLFGEWAVTTETKKPWLLFTSVGGMSSVLTRDNACRFHVNARGRKAAWQLENSQHFSFSDFQTLAPQFAQVYPEWPFASLYPVIVGDGDPVVSIRAQRRALAGFFRATLRPGPGSARLPDPPAGVTKIPATAFACE